MLRGHIRSAFQNKDLFNLVDALFTVDRQLKVYIHTWSIVASGLSYRPIQVDHAVVTRELIENYFGRLSNLVKHIIIENDAEIKLNGKTDGRLAKSACPLLAWKNYWYGKHAIAAYVHERESGNAMTIRFDVLNNPFGLTSNKIVDFWKRAHSKTLTRNEFLLPNYGADNVYIGSVDTIYKIAKIFNGSLDAILAEYPNTANQEFLVPQFSELLFPTNSRKWMNFS